MIPLLLFLPFLSHAGFDDGWSGFAAACATEMNARLARVDMEGKKWSGDAEQNRKDLVQMTEASCPAFLQRRNDPGAVQSFTLEKARVLDRSPLIKREGDRLYTELYSFLTEYQAVFRVVGIDFTRSRCGTQAARVLVGMRERLRDLESRIQNLGANCAAIESKESTAALGQKLETRGTSAPVPQGAERSTSSISGTERLEPQKQR
jgi:hypothetical protein